MVYDHYMSEETLRSCIHLVQTCLDVVELCLSDHTDLAQRVVALTLDNVAVIVAEMQESLKDGRCKTSP